MLATAVRAILVLLAICLVAAGLPTTTARTDPHASQIAATTVVAKLTPRRLGLDAPDHRTISRLVAVLPSPVGLVARPCQTLVDPMPRHARSVTPIVGARSSRGPPIA